MTKEYDRWKAGQRRSPTLADRTTPCECCRYPLSQRHHILGFAEHGEDSPVIHLCANCHELAHLLERWREEPFGKAGKMVQHLYSLGDTNTIASFEWILARVDAVRAEKYAMPGRLCKLDEDMGKIVNRVGRDNSVETVDDIAAEYGVLQNHVVDVLVRSGIDF